jgi:ligand-binding sensor domain-containing protein
MIQLRIKKATEYVVLIGVMLLVAVPIHAQWVNTNLPSSNIVTSLLTTGAADLYVATEGGEVFLNSVPLISWVNRSSGLPTGIGLRKFAYGVVGGGFNVLISSDRGVFGTTNNGVSWRLVGERLRDSSITMIYYDGGTLIAGTSTGGLYTFGGLDFQAMIIPRAPSASAIRLYYVPAGGAALLGTDIGLYRYNQAAQVWAPLTTFTTPSIPINALFDFNALYVATQGSGIYKSTDRGVSWTAVNTGLTGDALIVKSMSNSGSAILAATNDGVYRSTNDGASWTRMNQGLPPFLFVSSSVRILSDVFIGTAQGVWRRDSQNFLSVPQQLAAKAASFALEQNYPNPFNPTTGIRYQVSGTSDVRLEVFDMLGRKVSTLVNERQAAGAYQVSFNAANLSSGVYFYKLQAGSFTETRKMMLIK